MALYLNGNELYNSLVVDGGGGGSVKPEIVFAGSTPTGGYVSYTFLEGGTYQFYSFKRYNNTASAVDIAITLNNVALTPATYLVSGGGYGFAYGEITVQAGDVIKADFASWQGQSGLHLFVMKNCDVSAFAFLGLKTNDASTFSINQGGKSYLQAFQCSNAGGGNVFHYAIMDFIGDSIAVPNVGKYYYGFTYAIALE